MYLERVFDEDNQPTGYRLMTGVELLGNPEQEAAYASLGDEFTTAEARAAYGEAPDPTKKFLNKRVNAGILKKVGRGRWRKVRPEAAVERPIVDGTPGPVV